jgi:DNA-binding response OmpR family regulator
MRVLLVEGHEELAETVADVLRSEGMAVDMVLDGHPGNTRSSADEVDRAAG